MTQPNEQLILEIERFWNMQPGRVSTVRNKLKDINFLISQVRALLDQRENERLREGLEQIKAERDVFRSALDDVADYQHRWSDNPIVEVQKIARSILSSYPPREKGATE